MIDLSSAVSSRAVFGTVVVAVSDDVTRGVSESVPSCVRMRLCILRVRVVAGIAGHGGIVPRRPLGAVSQTRRNATLRVGNWCTYGWRE
jgi:hypothetical protein